MKTFEVEIREQYPGGNIGCESTIRKVDIIAADHKSAKLIAEARFKACVLSTNEIKVLEGCSD